MDWVTSIAGWAFSDWICKLTITMNTICMGRTWQWLDVMCLDTYLRIIFPWPSLSTTVAGRVAILTVWWSKMMNAERRWLVRNSDALEGFSPSIKFRIANIVSTNNRNWIWSCCYVVTEWRFHYTSILSMYTGVVNLGKMNSRYVQNVGMRMNGVWAVDPIAYSIDPMCI